MRCNNCNQLIEADGDSDTWVDAGTAHTGARLVYCNDQDGNFDGIRHEPKSIDLLLVEANQALQGVLEHPSADEIPTQGIRDALAKVERLQRAYADGEV